MCIFRLVISIIIRNVLAAPSVVKCLVKEKRCTCKVCYKCFSATVFRRRFDFLVVVLKPVDVFPEAVIYGG